MLFKKRNRGLDICSTRTTPRTNWIRKSIDGQGVSEKSGIGWKVIKKSLLLISECKKLVQKKCKQRHDNIARIAHLELCHKFGLVGKVKWYNHKPASIVENDQVKILWDVNIMAMSFDTEVLT